MNTEKPNEEEVRAAKAIPGQWLYRIAGQFSKNADVPPEAIMGAWKVDEQGNIDGEFKPNPNYDPEKYPYA